LVELAAVEAIYAAVLALPAVALMSWALRGPSATPTSLVPASAAGTMELASRRHTPGPRSRRRRRVRARVR
jgi:hypothetical protein